jgi:hypothetical protein
LTEALFELVRRILEEHSPQECAAFSTIGRDLIAGRLEKPSSGGKDPSQYGIAPELEAGLLMVHLVAGTLSLLEAYISVRRIREEAPYRAELQRSWEECLINNNVPPSIARLIPVHHTEELLRIINATKTQRE